MLAAALTVLAGVIVAWALTTASDRVTVVSVAQPIAAGDTIDAADLTTSDVAFDTGVRGLVPVASRDDLVGRVATIDLQPGTLLTVGMWVDGPELVEGEQSVGASLRRGTFPGGLARGDSALAVATEGDATPVPVRVLDAHADDASLSVTLAVPAGDAPSVARLAAASQLTLVGLP